MKKTRLDVHLSQAGLSISREKARRDIIAGWVVVDGETVRDPARTLTGGEEIRVERPGGLFVSRGGEKLRRALDVFEIDLAGRTAADLGASTGGFTDCMLRAGAAFVYAVDVGYGQLDYSLRTDPRVEVMERTNVRSLTAGRFSRPVDFFTADLSFISLTSAFPAARDAFPGSECVLLVKPQFEAGPSRHKKGVVREARLHREILGETLAALVSRGLELAGLTYSPVKGPRGNIEFLAHGRAGNPGTAGDIPLDPLVEACVEEAHRFFSDESAAKKKS